MAFLWGALLWGALLWRTLLWQLWCRPARQCCDLNGSQLWQFAGELRAQRQFRRICVAQFRKFRSDEGRHRLESPRRRILRDFYRSYALRLVCLPARLGGLLERRWRNFPTWP